MIVLRHSCKFLTILASRKTRWRRSPSTFHKHSSRWSSIKGLTLLYWRKAVVHQTLFSPAVFAQMRSITTPIVWTIGCLASLASAFTWAGSLGFHSSERSATMRLHLICLLEATWSFFSVPTLALRKTENSASSIAVAKTSKTMLAAPPSMHTYGFSRTSGNLKLTNKLVLLSQKVRTLSITSLCISERH